MWSFNKSKNNPQSPALTPKRSAWQNIGIGQEKDYFMDNFSMLLSAGVSIMAVLNSMQEEVPSERMKKIIAGLKNDIERGIPLWQALERTGFFPLHIVSLIKVGEESGRLTENLKVIAAQQERDRLFRSHIRSAALYPVFVLTLSVVAGSGIGWFILPRLAVLYSSLRLQLPIFTRILIALGNFLGSYGNIAIPSFLATTGICIYFLFFFKKTRFIGQALLLRLPGVKRLIQEVEVARFGYILGTLLQAGLPIVASLKSLSEATNYEAYRKFYLYLMAHIEGGDTFQNCFVNYKAAKRLLPFSVRQLITSGEQSGHLSSALLKIGETYEAKMELTAKNLATILEPFLLIVVWAVVLVIALAVILPLYSLIGHIR